MNITNTANTMGAQPFAALQPKDRAMLTDVLVALLKGVIYRDEDRHGRWKTILLRQNIVSWYMEFLGLELMVDEAEGYAYLRNMARDDDDLKEFDLPVPRLMPRHQLSYLASLLLALLRKELNEFDARGSETRLVLTLDQMLDRVRTFLPETTNEAGLRNHVGRAIDRIERLGFLSPMKGQENLWEVRRIIKAFVDAQWLADFDERLEEYRSYLKERGESLFRRGPRSRLVRVDDMGAGMDAGLGDAEGDEDADVGPDMDDPGAEWAGAEAREAGGDRAGGDEIGGQVVVRDFVGLVEELVDRSRDMSKDDPEDDPEDELEDDLDDDLVDGKGGRA